MSTLQRISQLSPTQIKRLTPTANLIRDVFPSPKIVIIGDGSAGLLTAQNLIQEFKKSGLSSDGVVVLGSNSGGASKLSSWYVAQHHPEVLEDRLLSKLGRFKNTDRETLVKYLAENHIEETEKFAETIEKATGEGVKRFTAGFSGIQGLTGFAPRAPLAGNTILKYLRDQVTKENVSLLQGVVVDVRKNEDNRFEVEYEDKERKKHTIRAPKIVIASGGMAHKHKFATTSSNNLPNIIELTRDKLGMKVEALGQVVYFPFAINHDSYRPGSILPPSFMVKAKILREKPDGSREEFLREDLSKGVRSGDYRPIFPDLTEAFNHEISSGNKVIIETEMDQATFERYKAEDHYGYVFKGKDFNTVKKGISVAPAYHTTLGGIDVDKELHTSVPGTYAIGEAALIYGEDRPLGGEHLSAITLSPLLAKVINGEVWKDISSNVNNFLQQCLSMLNIEH